MSIWYGNDKITKLLDWLYIGGIENNAKRSLKYVDIWINFAHFSKREKHIIEKVNNDFRYFPLRFDDGDLYEGQRQWLNAFEIIKENEDKKILITCSEGVSRSAVMCLWLLCEEFGDYDTALNYLKSKRSIHIDKGFNDFLLFLKEEYKNSRIFYLD